jgi:sporadic carbohydrate cluster 2OG-Fe(II) oxygenase
MAAIDNPDVMEALETAIGKGNTSDSLGDAFAQNGYVIRPAEDRDSLLRIQRHMADAAAESLGMAAPTDPTRFLDEIARYVRPDGLNAFRLHVINRLNTADWARQAYFKIARQTIESIIGNELAMQRNLALSIQLPEDDSSLLPTHSDVWSECSPFEMVLWTPFVDCFATKSMFILPLAESTAVSNRLADFKDSGVEGLFREIKDRVLWLDIPFGSFLLFNPSLIHGNRINHESTTRWSTNCRFKGLFTPYSDKRLGSFFEVLSMRPATRMALSYKLPSGFDD